MKLLGPRLANHLGICIEAEARNPVREGRRKLIDGISGYAVVGTRAQRIQNDVMDFHPIRVVWRVNAHAGIDQPFGLAHLVRLAILTRRRGAWDRGEGGGHVCTFRGRLAPELWPV